jgi:hypothetical protein
MAPRRCTKTGPYEVSRSRMRYRGAWSHGKASVIWREIHSAVGFSVTPNDSQIRRPCRMMTRQVHCLTERSMALYKGHSVTNVSPQRVKKCVAATCKKEGCDAVERCRRYAELSLSSKTMLEPPRKELAHLCVNVLAGRGRMSVKGVRRDKAAFSSGCKPHPATAPAGSNRSSHWPEFY